jgi:hypothetical protein
LVVPRQVLIRDTVWYYCYQDEKHFFEWLESIRAVKKVVGGPEGLTVHFSRGELSRESWGDLLGVFARYGLDMRPLQALVGKRHEAWLRDPKKYWHKAMWSDAKRRPAIRLRQKSVRQQARRESGAS